MRAKCLELVADKCPFCGGIETHFGNFLGVVWFVECAYGHCFARGPMALGKHWAIINWNMRVKEDKAEEK